MNVLVTGASGFVGRALIEYLLSHTDHSVVAATRRPELDFPSVVTHINVGNLTGETCWEKALSGVDCVIHIAARVHVMNDCSMDSLPKYKEANVEGTTNLARQAERLGVRRFVFVSSIGVNGHRTFGQPFHEKLSPKPVSAYACSKLEAENELRQISKNFDMKVVIVRPPLVYGSDAPGNFGRLVKLVSKVPALPFGLTNNLRSYISIGNLVHFLSLCAVHPKAEEQTFLVADGEGVSTKELVGAISSGLGKTCYQIPVPVGVMYFAAKLFGKEAQAVQLLGDLQVDSSKAQNLLGWRPMETMSQALSKLTSF